MTQHQVNEEKKRKFEEDIIEVAVVEYYLYADEHKRERKKKRCKYVLLCYATRCSERYKLCNKSVYTIIKKL